MKKIFSLIVLGTSLSLFGCNTNQNDEHNENNILIDSATSYCEEMGGKIIIHKTPDKSGRQIPYCNFGKKFNECEKWSFFKGDCEKKEKLESIITKDGYSLYNTDSELIKTVKNIDIKNNEIYFGENKKGILNADSLNISFYNKNVSFIGDPDKITSHYLEGAENFFYNGLEVSTTFKGPYKIYNEVDTKKITFSCDSPLINFNNKDYAGLNRKEVNWQYCETNENDFLTQFEFSAATGIGHATGGEITEKWYKLYIKKINDVNYIFIGSLKGNYLNSPNPDMNQEYKNKYLHISSKDYLDEILKNQDNKVKIEEWDKFVDSFYIVD